MQAKASDNRKTPSRWRLTWSAARLAVVVLATLVAPSANADSASDPCAQAREFGGHITELVSVSELLERKAHAACKARDRRTCRRMIRELVELLDWIEELNARRHEAIRACRATAQR